MELETLYSGTRWEIIKELSRESLSPMEIAEKINTTSANVSQQLRLLELAGLVESERTSNVEKGKPRIIYSLTKNNAYLILTSPHYADKMQFSLGTYHKFILSSWFLPNKDYHSSVAELYFVLQDHLDKIIVLAVKSGNKLDVNIAVTDKKYIETVKKAISLKKVSFNITTIEEFDIRDDWIILYNKTEVRV